MKKGAGFSLIEFMIVCVVIGILVTLAIPHYGHSAERSKCSAALNMLDSMRKAALEYYADNQTFSGVTLVDLEDLVGANFFSDGSNPDWNYFVAASAAHTITIQADRTGGPHDGMFITINESEQMGGTYPVDNP